MGRENTSLDGKELKTLFPLTKGKFYLVNPSNPAKIEKNLKAYYVRTRDKPSSNSPPFQCNNQIPPSPGTMHGQMPGVCPGGMLKFRIDRRITIVWHILGYDTQSVMFRFMNSFPLKKRFTLI